MKDNIRTNGQRSDFKQSVDQLESDGAKMKRVFAGQIASIEMEHAAEVDDMVFIIKKKQFLPFLFTPSGAAEVIAANGAVGYGINKSLREECEPSSPHKNKKKKRKSRG